MIVTLSLAFRQSQTGLLLRITGQAEIAQGRIIESTVFGILKNRSYHDAF